MRILLAGDSWTHTWVAPYETNNRGRHHKSVSLDRCGSSYSGFPTLRSYLREAGCQVTDISRPGHSQLDILNAIEHLPSPPGEPGQFQLFDAVVVLVPSPMRETNLDLSQIVDVSEFHDLYNKMIGEFLHKVNWAVQATQNMACPIIFLGGQTKVLQSVFDDTFQLHEMYPDADYVHPRVHLLAESILETLIEQITPVESIPNLSYSHSYQLDVGYFSSVELDAVSPNLVTFFHDVMVEHDTVMAGEAKDSKQIDLLTWPERAHLNPTGMFMLADMILEMIEDITDLYK